jgi:pantetheine-phosphate adenylyltransferase
VTVPTVLYPGSFDPIHNGHVEIVDAAARLFGDVVIAAMVNPDKALASGGLFDLADRVALIETSVAAIPGVRVVHHPGLAIDCARQVGADAIVKGLRSGTDFDVEMQMAQTNLVVSGIPTVFLPTTSAYGFVSSRFIREIAREGGDVSALVPVPVLRRLREVLPLADGRVPTRSR